MFKLACIAPFITIPATLVAGGLTFVRYYNPNTSIEKFIEAETNLLQKHVKTSNVTKKKVYIDNTNYLNTIKVENKENVGKKPNLLLIHGWGSGSPLWARNLDLLAQFSNVYAIDLLGFGLSSRPEFPVKATAEDAKRFWLDSIRQWKEAELPDEKVIIVGHSLGGFLSCAYTLENPDHVEKLILAAPVGIAPWRFSRSRNNDNNSNNNNIDNNNNNNNNNDNSSSEGRKGREATEKIPLARKIISELIWTYGYSPQSILRGAGYYSKPLWDRLGDGSNYRELDKDCWEYLYHSQISDPSGDVAFLKLLSMDGWNTPLYDDLHQLKVPMRIIYGEKDYISYKDGPKIIERVNTPSDFVVLPSVGHHLYWVQHNEFVSAISQFVNSHPKE